MTRLLRERSSRDAIEGLSLGDAFGEQFFRMTRSEARFAATHRLLPARPWPWTDDTSMALSVLEVISAYGEADEDQLARSFSNHYDATRGYGNAMDVALQRVRAGEPWKLVAADQFNGQGSAGNGAAMRVAPLGAWFSDDLEVVREQARRSALVTHTHPEAVAGAVAVAIAAALASADSQRPQHDPDVWLNNVADLTPRSQVAETLYVAAVLPRNTATVEAACKLGNGGRFSALDTVPFALWLASRYSADVVECLWQAVSAGGDTDTTCAIAGAVVATRLGRSVLPRDWIEARERLPIWVADLGE